MKEIILLVAVVCGACVIVKSVQYLLFPPVSWVMDEMRSKAESEGGVFVQTREAD